MFQIEICRSILCRRYNNRPIPILISGRGGRTYPGIQDFSLLGIFLPLLRIKLRDLPIFGRLEGIKVRIVELITVASRPMC
jgi:hypothetical protein